MKRYICQDCGHQVIAAQKPSACEVCNGTILLPFEGKKSLNGKSDKPRTMIDVTGFGVKKQLRKPSPLPPLPPPSPTSVHSANPPHPKSRRSSATPPQKTNPPPAKGRRPSRQPPKKASPPPQNPDKPSKKTQYTPGSFDSAMMNIAAKPSVSLDSSLLSSYQQPIASYQNRQRRSKRSFSFSFPFKGVFWGGLSLMGLALLSLSVIWSYRWLINPINVNNFQNIVLEDNFSAAQKWSLTNGAKIKDGGLFHRQPKVKHYGASIWTGQDFSNVDFSADVKKVNGPDNVPYGLVTRIGGDSYQDFYYLLISGNGTWVMGKHTSGSWHKKGKWRKSKLINQGNQASNRLRIVSQGNAIVGYINGKKVGHFRDPEFQSGKIAVTSMRGTGDAVAVYFDNVVAKIEGEPQ